VRGQVRRQTFFLGRLFGVRVGVHVSWLAVYAFMTIVIARGLAGLPVIQAYGLGALCALALFASVVGHEFAHAIVARRFGVQTRAITLFLFGGVAELEAEPGTPRADAVIAAAGPAMSAVLGVVALAATFAIDRYVPGGLGEALGRLGAYVALVNGVLAVFNMIPAYPMDGGRVLRAALWQRGHDRRTATIAASRIGMAFALIFVGAGVLAAAALHDLSYGWCALMGTFLLRQSWSQQRALRTSGRRATGDVPATA
jgi:Zn-dependent protease